jgi:hypothetical protein
MFEWSLRIISIIWDNMRKGHSCVTRQTILRCSCVDCSIFLLRGKSCCVVNHEIFLRVTSVGAGYLINNSSLI